MSNTVDQILKRVTTLEQEYLTLKGVLEERKKRKEELEREILEAGYDPKNIEKEIQKTAKEKENIEKSLGTLLDKLEELIKSYDT